MLAKAAVHHCNDTGPGGLTGHNSTNGDNMSKRLKKFGASIGHSGENIAYGKEKGLEIVI